jgi:photosystem II stability/assembly factor-like uncharacterized protein
LNVVISTMEGKEATMTSNANFDRNRLGLFWGMRNAPWRNRCILLILTAGVLVTATGCRKKSKNEYFADKLKIDSHQVAELREIAGLSDAALERIRKDQVPAVLRETKYPDLPMARVRYQLLLEKSERGEIPEGARLRALRQLVQLRSSMPLARYTFAGLPVRTPAARMKMILPQTAGLNPNNSGWRFLGPTEVGGRTRAIAFDPKDPNAIWIGSVGGGVWKSTDAGATFLPVNDLMANLVVSSLVIDPSDSKIVYAGTGEGFYNVDALRGAGIFRTINGKDWSQLPATTDTRFQWVNRLAISHDGKVLLAATRQGMFRSEDSDRKTWSATSLSANLADVRFHPSDSGKAVAGGLDTGQAYYSEDGGKSWNSAKHAGNWVHVSPDGTRSSGRVEVTYAIKDPSIVYASVDNNSGEIWKSTDGGQSYTKMSSFSAGSDPPEQAYYLGAQGWYGDAIWANDPTSADLIIVGGINLWKSTDGGKTLVDISDWSQDGSPHADYHAIVSDPGYNGTTNKTVYLGNDGGIFKATDITTAGTDEHRTSGWIRMNHNYGVTQFYAAAWNPKSGVVLGGAQDNGTLSHAKDASENKWGEEFGGDGGYCATDPNDGNYLFGEYVYLSLHRSMDGGSNADFIDGRFWNETSGKYDWKPAPYFIPDSKAQAANFIAPFVLDPNDSNRILAGGISLWRTNDAKTQNTLGTGPQWARIKDPGSDNISAIAISPGNSDLIWACQNDGRVFKTANGTQVNPAWEATLSEAPKRFCTNITIDPVDHTTVYVTFGGYSENGAKDNVWKTKDSGTHWTNISSNLVAAPAYALAVHPANHNFIYLGTEVGIFASTDAGLHWSPTNEGPTNASVNSLVWMDKNLLAATHGRGMWKYDLTSVPSAP